MPALAGLFLGLLCLVGSTVMAQVPKSVMPLVTKYADEAGVMLKNEAHLVITYDDKKKGVPLRMMESYHTDKLIVNEQIQAVADDRIYFNETFDRILNVEATAYMIKRGKHKGVKVNNIETKSKLNGSIFYHDNKFKEVTYPKIPLGGRAVLSYKQETLDPRFLGGFYFSSFMPTQKAEYSVTFPEGVEVKYKLFNDPDGKIKFSKTLSDDGSWVYRWTAEEVDKYEIASNAPSISYYEPHVIVYIGSYQYEGEKVQILSDVSDLYYWYRSLVKDVNTEANAEVITVADSLTAGASTDREKVTAIYNWVRENIKYVAFEAGMSGFVPRPAGLVCSRRFGDCKDMSSILTELLKASDVEAHLTWIGTRDIPYSYTEVPTPMVDNHMIAAIKLDGEYVFLDATSQYTPLGWPTSFIQGKEALVGTSEKSYELVRVPEVDNERNKVTDSVWVEVDGGTLKGTGHAAFHGYSKVDMVRPFMAQSEADKKDFLQATLEKGHNKFKLTDYTISGTDASPTPLLVNYSFEIPNYSKGVAGSIYINLQLDKMFQNVFFKSEERNGLDREMRHKQLDESVVILDIPEGYKVSDLPKKTSFKEEGFGFEITYKSKKGKVLVTRKVYTTQLVIKEAQFDLWNKMIDSLGEAYSEAVVLKRVM